MHILKNQVSIKQLPTKDIEGKFNFFFKFLNLFLGLFLWHMEDPR